MKWGVVGVCKWSGRRWKKRLEDGIERELHGREQKRRTVYGQEEEEETNRVSDEYEG